MKGVTCRDEPAENINHNQQSSWSILGTFSSVFWFHDSQRYSLSPSVARAGSCFKPEVSDKPTLHHLYGTKQTEECWKKNIKTFCSFKLSTDCEKSLDTVVLLRHLLKLLTSYLSPVKVQSSWAHVKAPTLLRYHELPAQTASLTANWQLTASTVSSSS